MVDFLTKIVFRSEQQSTNKIEIKQIETYLSFLVTKSLVRVHCTEKWNRNYQTYPGGDHYRFIFPHKAFSYISQCKDIFRLQTGHCLLNYHEYRMG